MSSSDPYSDHWRLLFPPSEFLAWQEFKGRDVTLTVHAVTQEQIQVVGRSETEPRAIVRFDETAKKLALNKTNARALSRHFGTPKTSEWIGRSCTLYPDPTVRFGPEIVGGIRVRVKR